MEEKSTEVREKSSNAGFILSIIAIATSFIPIINNGSFVLGVIAIILAILGIIKKQKRGKHIFTIILAILAICITISIQNTILNAFKEAEKGFNHAVDNAQGKNTQDILKNNLDINFGKFKAVDKGYGIMDTELEVQVKNKANEQKGYTIEIEAVDASNNRIASDTIFANGLAANQSQKFKLFKFVESDKIQQLKKATFKVVKVSIL